MTKNSATNSSASPVPGRINTQAQSNPVLRLILPVCLIVLSLAGVGCRPEAKVATGSNPAGSYTLVSVDQNQVPCAVQHDGHSLTIKSGLFTINSDGTCGSKMVFTPPSGQEVTHEVKATYTQHGSELTMKWQGAGMTKGNIDKDTFTMNNEGMVLVFRK